MYLQIIDESDIKVTIHQQKPRGETEWKRWT